MRSGTQVQGGPYMDDGVSTARGGKGHLWIEMQGMRGHGGSWLLFLMKWEAYSSTEDDEGEEGLEI